MKRTSLLPVLAAMLSAAPVAAQGHPHGQPAPMQPGGHMGMMMQMPMEMMMAGPEMILHMRQELGLTAAQVQRLEAIQRETAPQHQVHMNAAMQPMRDAQAILNSEHPDFGQYEAKMRQAAEHHVAAHVAMARAMVQARAVLTADQRTRLQLHMATMHQTMMSHMNQMMGGGMMHGGAHGAPAHNDSSHHPHP